jgi:hypothetical protein
MLGRYKDQILVLVQDGQGRLRRHHISKDIEEERMRATHFTSTEPRPAKRRRCIPTTARFPIKRENQQIFEAVPVFKSESGEGQQFCAVPKEQDEPISLYAVPKREEPEPKQEPQIGFLRNYVKVLSTALTGSRCKRLNFQ